MATETKLVYRSTHPAVQQWWDDYQAAMQRVLAERRAFKEEFPHLTLMGYDNIVSSVEASWKVEMDPTVWKRAGRNGMWAPRAKGGEAMSKRFAAMSHQEPPIPGMPTIGLSSPGLEPDTYESGAKATFWLTWGKYASQENIAGSSAFDPEMWEQMKLSDLHLMREARDEAGVKVVAS